MNPKIETFFDAKPVLSGNFKKFPNNSFHIKEKKHNRDDTNRKKAQNI